MTMFDFVPFLKVDAIYDQEGKSNEEKYAAVQARNERITGRIMAVSEELGYAFMELNSLRKVGGEFGTLMETAKAYKELYGHLWTAYRDRFQNLMKALGYDVGFIFQDDKKFEIGAKQYITTHPDAAELMDRVRDDRGTWQNALHIYRNDGQHDASGGPTFNGHPMHSLPNGEVMFYNTWHAMEDIFLTSMQEELGEQLTIFEIPKDQRRPEMPKKYQVGIQLDEQTGEVLSRKQADKRRKDGND